MKKALVLVLAASALAGCVRDPSVRVADVSLARQSPEGGRVEVVLALANPNDTPLPLVDVKYRVALKGTETFAVKENLSLTLPAKGAQTVKLTAAFPGQPLQGRTFTVSGRISYRPPPTLLERLLEENLPLPKARFHHSGTLIAAAAPAAPPAP